MKNYFDYDDNRIVNEINDNISFSNHATLEL